MSVTPALTGTLGAMRTGIEEVLTGIVFVVIQTVVDAADNRSVLVRAYVFADEMYGGGNFTRGWSSECQNRICARVNRKMTRKKDEKEDGGVA